MHKLSLAGISVNEVHQDEAVRIAAEAGFDGVSLSMGLNKSVSRVRMPSVVGDPDIRRKVRMAFADTGIEFAIAEGLSIDSHVDFDTVREGLAIVRDLGANRVGITAWDADDARMQDTLSRCCDLAMEAGIRPMIEFTALSQVRTLRQAVEMAGSGKFAGLQVLCDALHLQRSGETPRDLAAVPHEIIGFAQICDGPSHSPSREAYMDEAIAQRGIPGDGNIPLSDFVRALPAQVQIGVEIPNRKLEQQGVSPLDRARLYHAAARAVLEQAAS